MTASPEPGAPVAAEPRAPVTTEAGVSVSAEPGAPAAARERSPAQGRLPDFFIVGHQKCGTTALYEMLRMHPQLFLPDVKEPRYFATDQRSRFAVTPGPGRPRTLEAYLALFAAARAEQLVGEASPQYLRSAAAPHGIAQVCPHARIIAILREPAAYLRSFHLQMVSSNVETERDFRKALALEDERRRGRRIPRRCQHPEALLYSDHVRYTEQLRRYHEQFGRERVLVLIYEEFLRDNVGTVRQVLRFLGVDEHQPVEQVRTYRVRAVRHLWLHYLANAARRARRNPAGANRLGRVVNALAPDAAGSLAFRRWWRALVYGPAPAPDERLALELRDRFEGEVRTLGQYLGRDLSSVWGYDAAG